LRQLAIAGLPAALYCVQNLVSLLAYQNLDPVAFNVLCRNPRRGEVLSGELQVLFDRDSEEPTTVGRFAARPGSSSREEATVTSGAVEGEGNPWRGKSPREDRVVALLAAPATDFRGGQSPEGGRGRRRHRAARPFEPTPGGPGRPEGRPMPRKGKPSKGRNPMSATV
jgi:hypothetical protein